MAAISFEELIVHVGISADKLNLECSDQHISDISRFLTNWQSIAPHLGLTERDEDVEQDGKKAQDWSCVEWRSTNTSWHISVLQT